MPGTHLDEPASRYRLALCETAIGRFKLLNGGDCCKRAEEPPGIYLIGKLGSKTVTTWSTMGFCVALMLPSFAFDPLSLFAALVVYGAMAGANDVCINSQAAPTPVLRPKAGR